MFLFPRIYPSSIVIIGICPYVIRHVMPVYAPHDTLSAVLFSALPLYILPLRRFALASADISLPRPLRAQLCLLIRDLIPSRFILQKNL